MGKVIDILKNTPHLSGKCVCLECGHEWIGVSPVGVCSMECPECGLMKGVHRGVACPDTVWECNCGCTHFFVLENYEIQCAYCGVVQNFTALEGA